MTQQLDLKPVHDESYDVLEKMIFEHKPLYVFEADFYKDHITLHAAGPQCKQCGYVSKIDICIWLE